MLPSDLTWGKTQVTNVLKRKAEILDDIEYNAPGDRKRKMRKTGNEEINDLCNRLLRFKTCT